MTQGQSDDGCLFLHEPVGEELMMLCGLRRLVTFTGEVLRSNFLTKSDGMLKLVEHVVLHLRLSLHNVFDGLIEEGPFQYTLAILIQGVFCLHFHVLEDPRQEIASRVLVMTIILIQLRGLHLLHRRFS